jgi:hypothetical protein
MVKSRTIAVKQRAAGDYSVSVDRSGRLCLFTIAYRIARLSCK